MSDSENIITQEYPEDFKFNAGYAYWEKTKPYWDDVRAVWNIIMATQSEFKLKKEVDGKKLHEYNFQYAQDATVLGLSSIDRQKFIRDLLDKFMVK